MRDLEAYATTNRTRLLGDLKELLRIPSISTDPTHAEDCRRAADWLAHHLRTLGCARVELLGSPTHPVVFAEGPNAGGRPTVLVYGHYDVQPPEPLDEWETPPFEPTERNGNLYARGATDDKGQAFAIVKAFEAVTRDGTPPVNVRFLIEGQEESGSKVLAVLLEDQPELVNVDVVVIADMPYYAPGWPAVEAGLRGLVYGEISVRTLQSDLHSGLYGGVAPNAHEVLVRMLARLKGADGRIEIPGLYEAVRRPSKKERDAWAKLPFSEAKFLNEELKAKALTGLARYPVLERIWALPTFEIHGIRGGFTGEGAKTVIPAAATAKVSLRLVPDQKAATVQEQVIQAVEAVAPPYADVSVTFGYGADPVLVDTNAPAFRHLDRAFREVEGRGVVPIRSGGSIPIVPALGKRGAAVVLSGIGLPDDGLHAPNEKIGVDQFLKGVRVFGRFFRFVGGGAQKPD